MCPFNDYENLRQVIDHLDIGYCRLPSATAIASFLYGREYVPIIDRYVARFFGEEIQPDEIQHILEWTANMEFVFAANGRLVVPSSPEGGYDYNKRLYIDEFVPECRRIADSLNEGGYHYQDVDEEMTEREFTPVDVEMAIFSWAMQNRNLYSLDMA